ncbi:Gfo/Idh/MocA family protein [Rhizomonospora bruguierae]|uniref:Gfo/Idh/MocA family protein n=1 Tax=Rhizomonospora bruguierae TaxID=1581705 RepID=UPI001BCFEA42|nr:Gfo/Idh/MocA family oxidoreductase [Micromonospora sp. NBRC 107566]
MTVRVALVGASGHGRWHRRHIAELAAAGRVRLVGLADVRPVGDAPPGVPVFTDHRDLLREAAPEVVVVCTPPHTHLPIATDVLRSGADLLLEKPPVLSAAEHRALSAVVAETGRACQVGFQALGSAALAELTGAIAAGQLGRVTGVSALACWQRDDAYYARAPWAGRRTVDGRPSLDGALANPLAHAVMQAIAVSESAIVAGNAGAARGVLPGTVEVECYRTRPIEVDDTSTLRLTPREGPPVLVAVTLAGEDFVAGEIAVTGTAGRALLEYPTDRLRLPGDPASREVPGRVSLLANLLDHRADRDVPLVAPLARTAPFTAVLDAVRAAGDPVLLGPDVVVPAGEPPARVNRIPGINAALRACVERLALLSETGVPWAAHPYRELVS